MECKDIVCEVENKTDIFTPKLLAIASNVESWGLPFKARDKLSGAILILIANSFIVMPWLWHSSLTFAFKFSFILVFLMQR